MTNSSGSSTAWKPPQASPSRWPSGGAPRRRPGPPADERADEAAVERAVLRADLCERLPDAAGIRDRVRLALQGPAGPVLLEASVLPAAARDAVRHEADVAELGADAVAAAEEPVARDDRAADAGADGEHDHVADEAAGAEAELRPARGVRVVLDRRPTCRRGPRASPGTARCASRCSGRGSRWTAVAIDEPGGGDAHGRDVGPLAERDATMSTTASSRAAGRRRRRDAFAPHDGAVFVDHRPGDLRPADVDTDRVHQEAAFRRG